MSDLHWMTATEAAQAITARKLSPVELMKALLERIARLDPKLNVFIRFDGDAAMDAAKAAEAEVASGRLRGPLHGVPVGIKDIIDVAGVPTTCHSKILIDNVMAADAVCVSRLRGAGAIVLGKLSTHEFAIGGPSFDLPWPPGEDCVWIERVMPRTWFDADAVEQVVDVAFRFARDSSLERDGFEPSVPLCCWRRYARRRSPQRN
jgi:aspartyl-tRNA(Asn)/glutamyl-tRNA(Gln) amidotransferase subunit A